MGPVPLAIAHRGDPVAERENTLPAFTSAVREGADMVELDLRRTSDGEIVVLHDATLARLWGDGRNVADLNLAAVREIGRGQTRIPTFREVLHHIDVPLMVDLNAETVEGALHEVRQAAAMARALFVTGDVAALRHLRELAPDARIGLTWVEREPPPPTLLQELRAEYWNPAFTLVTPDRVAEVHGMGLKVSTWTVDKPRHMARVAAAGVDAIVSNRIRQLRRHLA
ncbi:MAG: glycerophosphodiester phosphodiesterase [Acidimicrobiales bacterium]